MIIITLAKNLINASRNIKLVAVKQKTRDASKKTSNKEKQVPVKIPCTQMLIGKINLKVVRFDLNRTF